MTKKKILKIVIPLVFVLILVAGGFFWWEKREIKGSPNDYVIKETSEGVIVENKKARLRVKAPEGWEVDQMKTGEGFMIFSSSDSEGELRDDKIAPPLTRGCIIYSNILYERMDIDQLKLEANYNLSLLGVKSKEFEEITINNYQALKIIADTQKVGPSIGIDMPYKNRTYSFFLGFAPNDKDNCIRDFDKFLETVLIN